MALLLAPANGGAQELGSVDFPTSGAPEAQPHFEAGLLFLHNFEYEDAEAAFRKAREIDPGFAMAYWGEAQTYNHPIWMQQDREAALAVLRLYAPTARERLARAPTPRERDWLETVEILYGDGPKEARDFQYRDAMRRLHEKYPDDHDAATLYALSLLGTAHGGRDFATYVKAAAIAQPVLRDNPMHPGAAHYVIHAFDDPVHAPLGLTAARAYSEIAPDAGHAQHMTSHIFVAMGLWDDVVTANIRARDVQNAGLGAQGSPRQPVRGTTRPGSTTDTLQLGRLEDAAAGMAACRERMGDTPTRDEAGYFVNMRARAVIDAADWSLAGAISADLDAFPGLALPYDFVDALSAMRNGDLDGARRIRARHGDPGEVSNPRHGILLLELDGLVALAAGDPATGISLLEDAARREESLPYEFGPPATLMPPHEPPRDRAGRARPSRRGTPRVGGPARAYSKTDPGAAGAGPYSYCAGRRNGGAGGLRGAGRDVGRGGRGGSGAR